jgi:upstream activation factor subunit UAF30
MPAATKKTPVVAVKKPVAAKVPVIKAADAVKPAPVQKIEEPVKPETVQPAAPQENVLQGIVEKVNIVVTMGKELQSQLKVLSKEWDKQQKIIDKVQKKRQNAKNSPSGFAKPNKISNELCDFIGEPHGTEKSRTDITRFINAYIKEHNLNKPENKRFILPDEKLRKILNVDAKEEINYFILQKLISHHFPPSASKLAAAAAAAAK